jgi:hypothetical protein
MAPGHPAQEHHLTKYLARLFDNTARRDDAARVEISPSGQSSVDFTEVMKTQRFRDDLEAIRRIASRAEPVKN